MQDSDWLSGKDWFETLSSGECQFPKYRRHAQNAAEAEHRIPCSNLPVVGFDCKGNGNPCMRIELARARIRSQSHPSAPPRYRMLEQFAGAGASIRRFDLLGSNGTSWTAMLDAGTEPSFRMMCT